MRPLVTAHSGCEDTVPNSIESFKAAVLGKADAAEIDVRISKDRIPVLSHDSTWFSVAEEAALSISERCAVELSGIVTLREILEIASENSISLNLDIKDFSAVDEVIKLLKITGTDRKSVFSGYSPDQVIKLRNIYPDAGFMVNISEDFVSEEIISLYRSDKNAFTDIITDIYRRTGGICLNMSYEFCDPEMLDTLRKRFIPVSVWTVDDLRFMKLYAASDAWSITTSHVRQLSGIINGTVKI